MFKKKLNTTDFLKSIKQEPKPTPAKDLQSDLFALKKEGENMQSAQISDMVANLSIKQQVKFSETIPQKTDLSEFLKQNANKKFEMPKFKYNLDSKTRERISKIFAHSSKEYFIAMKELQ